MADDRERGKRRTRSRTQIVRQGQGARPRAGLRIQTLRCTLAAWPAADYEEGSFLSRRGRLSLACSGRQLPDGLPFLPLYPSLASLSSFSRGSSCPQPASAPPVPFRPHAARRARPGTDNPRKPEAGAVTGSPGGGRDDRVLSAASGRGKEEADTVITTDRPRLKPLLPQGLLETRGRPACHRHDGAWERPGATGQASGEGLELGAAARGGASGAGGGSGGALEAGSRPASAPGGVSAFFPSPLLSALGQLPGAALTQLASGTPAACRSGQLQASRPAASGQNTPPRPPKGLARLTAAPGRPPPPRPAPSAPPCRSRAPRMRRPPTARRRGQGWRPNAGRQHRAAAVPPRQQRRRQRRCALVRCRRCSTAPRHRQQRAPGGRRGPRGGTGAAVPRRAPAGSVHAGRRQRRRFLTGRQQRARRRRFAGTAAPPCRYRRTAAAVSTAAPHRTCAVPDLQYRVSSARGQQ